MKYRELAEFIVSELVAESIEDLATDRVEDILEDYFRFKEEE